jgi:hypothetical protein
MATVAEERHRDRTHIVGAEHPWRANTGKDVDVADAEHGDRATISDDRPCARGSTERKRESLRWRLACRYRDLLNVSLSHVARDVPDMDRAGGDDVRMRFHVAVFAPDGYTLKRATLA